MPALRRSWAAMCTLCVIAITACSSGEGSSATTDSGSTSVTTEVSTTSTGATTTVPAQPPPLYDGLGPYAVGVITLDLGDRKTEVWYPVDPEAIVGQATEIFDTLTIFPESLRVVIPKEISGTFDTGAVRDAPVSAHGPFPAVVYSHGFGGFRQAFTTLTSHLASWGFVVASTDHLERGLAAQATGQLKIVPGQDLVDVTNSLDAIKASALGSATDLEHVGIVGHSAGAGTAARAALELPGIDAYESISGGARVEVTGDDVGVVFAGIQGPVGTHDLEVIAVTAADATIAVDGGIPQVIPLDELVVTTNDGTVTLGTLPLAGLTTGTFTVTRAVSDKPLLVVAADLDAVVDPAASMSLYGVASAPKFLVRIDKAGHNSFTDSCRGIRKLGGLGALIPLIGEKQAARGENGCTAENVDPELVWRVVTHYTVAFFRTYLGVADDSASLAEDVTSRIGEIDLTDFSVEP